MGDRYRQAAGVGTASAFVGELDTWGPFAAAAADGEAVADVREDSPIVEWSRTAKMPTRYGTFSVRAFRDRENREHVVLFQGDMAGQTLVPVRVHSECLTSEVLGSLRCDCKTQLDMALAHIAERGIGMLIYLRQEGRGTGLVSKIDAYALQDTGLDTVEAGVALGVPVDARTYELAGEVIRLFDIASISLLTNNPVKIESLREQGVEVAQRTPILSEPNEFNDAYLRAKKSKMSHLF
jgi:GTP cyclohydrolase II